MPLSLPINKGKTGRVYEKTLNSVIFFFTIPGMLSLVTRLMVEKTGKD